MPVRTAAGTHQFQRQHPQGGDLLGVGLHPAAPAIDVVGRLAQQPQGHQPRQHQHDQREDRGGDRLAPALAAEGVGDLLGHRGGVHRQRRVPGGGGVRRIQLQDGGLAAVDHGHVAAHLEAEVRHLAGVAQAFQRRAGAAGPFLGRGHPVPDADGEQRAVAQAHGGFRSQDDDGPDGGVGPGGVGGDRRPGRIDREIRLTNRRALGRHGWRERQAHQHQNGSHRQTPDQGSRTGGPHGGPLWGKTLPRYRSAERRPSMRRGHHRHQAVDVHRLDQVDGRSRPPGCAGGRDSWP